MHGLESHDARARDARTSDAKACEELLARGSKSFHAASRLMPQRLRAPTAAVYAFCRVSDDAVDSRDASVRSHEELRERLERIYRHAPRNDVVERAFAEVVHAYRIPRAVPEALLDGFAWDLEGRTYERFTDVCAYAVRVASSVGVMMSILMGARSWTALARACDLGVAMQLTNIARDVGEDARHGRVYLPSSWLAYRGIAPRDVLEATVASAELRAVTHRLLQRAERLYVRAEDGIGWLPRDCRVAIMSARLIYAAIGRDIALHGYDSVTRRAVTTKLTKAQLVAKAAAHTLVLTKGPISRECLSEARFLIDAACEP